MESSRGDNHANKERPGGSARAVGGQAQKVTGPHTGDTSPPAERQVRLSEDTGGSETRGEQESARWRWSSTQRGTGCTKVLQVEKNGLLRN